MKVFQARQKVSPARFVEFAGVKQRITFVVGQSAGPQNGSNITFKNLDFFPAADIFQMFSGPGAEQCVKTAVSLAGLFRFAEFGETFAFKNFGGNMLLVGLLQFLRFGFGMLAGFFIQQKGVFISSFGGVSISNSAARVSSRREPSAMSAAFR